jgi:hypothetical protein
MRRGNEKISLIFAANKVRSGSVTVRGCFTD